MDGSVDGPYRSGNLAQLRRAANEIMPRYYNHHGPGVTFFDLAKFYKEGTILHDFLDWTVRSLGEKLGRTITKVTGPESRAWPLAGALARDLTLRYGTNDVGVVLVRKPGKLPGKIDREEYRTEYSSGTLEISQGDIEPGDKVLEIDDLSATGGSITATGNLVTRQGGILVAVVCPIELPFCGGRELFEGAHPGVPLKTLLQYKQGTFHEDVNCYEMVLMEDGL